LNWGSIPERGKGFSHHLVQIGQTSCPTPTGSNIQYSLEVKWPECDTDLSPPSDANVKRVDFHLHDTLHGVMNKHRDNYIHFEIL
jgi:hypothetical protein